MRDLAETVAVSRAEIIQRAMSMPEFLTDPRKTGANENHAVRIITLLRDDRFLNGRSAGARLGEAFVFARPIIIAVSAEFGFCHHLLQIGVREMPEHGRLAEISLERAFAVNSVDMLAQPGIVAHEIPQALPADLEQFSIADGENGRRARH